MTLRTRSCTRSRTRGIPRTAPEAIPTSRIVSLQTDERGAATVWAAYACVAVITLLGVILLLVTAVQTCHHVSFWADGAALAGAAHVREGENTACAAAATYLAHHDDTSTLQNCTLITHPDTHMPALKVVVTRPFHTFRPLAHFTVEGRACAGPMPG